MIFHYQKHTVLNYCHPSPIIEATHPQLSHPSLNLATHLSSSCMATHPSQLSHLSLNLATHPSLSHPPNLYNYVVDLRRSYTCNCEYEDFKLACFYYYTKPHHPSNSLSSISYLFTSLSAQLFPIRSRGCLAACSPKDLQLSYAAPEELSL